jgi:hypothetical protein
MMEDLELQKLQEEIETLELQAEEFVAERKKEEGALALTTKEEISPAPAAEVKPQKPKAKAKAKAKAKLEEKKPEPEVVKAPPPPTPAPATKKDIPLYGAARVKSKLVGYAGR